MSNTIKLTYPIDVEGNTLDKITLRRPKARDLKALERAKGGDVTKTVDLIASLAEIPPSAVDEMDAADFQQVNGAIADFLGQAA